jgi:hypothetical protein
VRVEAPMCVQSTFFTQESKEGRRLVVHLFNNLNTTANHGLPAADVPLREETVPVPGIRLRFERDVPKRCRLEPEGRELALRRDGAAAWVEVPPLQLHTLVVAEY